jgi:hypothetical protein|tara:strand:- start:46 stop:195 length:150 start_codon:yes stop_codon:yes gene_type:complete
VSVSYTAHFPGGSASSICALVRSGASKRTGKGDAHAATVSLLGTTIAVL